MMFLAIKKYPYLFIFALLTSCLLAYLGHWQYEKGADKEIVDAARVVNLAKQTINLNSISKNLELEDGMKVQLKGHFIDDKNIYHDNRLNLGKAGYHIYSVFVLDNAQAVLVNRGWASVGNDRNNLPSVTTNNEAVEIEGYIRFPVKNVYTLKSDQLESLFPLRVQTIEVDDLSKLSGYELAEYAVLLSADVSGEHFSRKWIDLLPGKYMSADKHYAYSLQWYSLALVGLVIFMVLIMKMANNEQRKN